MLIDDLLYALGQLRDTSNLDEGLKMAVRFQVDNVARYVHEERREQAGKFFPLQDHIPNIAPLAPVMWFEYGGASVEKSAINRYGCLLTIDYDRTGYCSEKWIGAEVPDNTRWILRAECWEKWADVFHVTELLHYVFVAEDGQFLGAGAVDNPRVVRNARGYDVLSEKSRKLYAEMAVALMSICFSHCKGTVIEEHQPSRQVRRAAERKEKPVFTFHTIDIQPATRILHTEGHVTENGLARALHICRGHFAHYTAEKPLFGKYTGTFYRPMHVRGSAEKGMSVKDYRVHASTSD